MVLGMAKANALKKILDVLGLLLHGCQLLGLLFGDAVTMATTARFDQKRHLPPHLVKLLEGKPLAQHGD